MRVAFLLVLANAVLGFKLMSSWKMPTVGDVMKGREAATRFGSKKLVQKRLWGLIEATQMHVGRDKFVNTFGKFCGLVRPSLSESLLDLYLKALGSVSMAIVYPKRDAWVAGVEVVRVREVLESLCRALQTPMSAAKRAVEQLRSSEAPHVQRGRPVTMVQLEPFMDKVLGICMEYQKQERETLMELFKTYDKNSDGELELSEWKTMCAELASAGSLTLTDSEMSAMYMDALEASPEDCDGITGQCFADVAQQHVQSLITNNSLEKVLRSKSRSDAVHLTRGELVKSAAVLRLFARFVPKSATGVGQDAGIVIDCDSIQPLVSELGDALTSEEIRELLHDWDPDHTGKIAFVPFLAWWRDHVSTPCRALE